MSLLSIVQSAAVITAPRNGKIRMGYGTEYAEIQHEGLNFEHDDGEAKFSLLRAWS